MKKLHPYLPLPLTCLVIFSLLTIPVPAAYSAEQKQPLQVIVSILPQEYFVKRIGGNRVKVESLIQPGHSPATYSPTPKQMAKLASSTIYFRIGVPFENTLIPKLTRLIPNLTIVDLRHGIDMIPVEDSDDEHDEHHHSGMDPHTWLDPMLALKQSTIIRDTLTRFDPKGEAIYTNNLSLLTQDLNELDLQLKQTIKPFAGKTIYVFHPAYGYFCRAYGLYQKAINPDGKEPGARYLARLIEQAKKDSVRVIFVQPQFSDKAAQTIAKSIGANIVAIDPLAVNYLDNMKSIAQQLKSSLPAQDKQVIE